MKPSSRYTKPVTSLWDDDELWVNCFYVWVESVRVSGGCVADVGWMRRGGGGRGGRGRGRERDGFFSI